MTDATARDLSGDLADVLAFEHAGLWIEAQCRALGVTPHALAKQAKLSPTTVCRWVNQQTEPELHSLRKISRVVVSFWATREEKNR